MEQINILIHHSVLCRILLKLVSLVSFCGEKIEIFCLSVQRDFLKATHTYFKVSEELVDRVTHGKTSSLQRNHVCGDVLNDFLAFSIWDIVGALLLYFCRGWVHLAKVKMDSPERLIIFPHVLVCVTTLLLSHCLCPDVHFSHSPTLLLTVALTSCLHTSILLHNFWLNFSLPHTLSSLFYLMPSLSFSLFLFSRQCGSKKD